MHAPITHIHSELSNQTLPWHGSDSESVYQKNLLDRRDELERYGWIDADITYRFNSHGFRSDEFDSSPSIMFLGCSHTMGTGLAQHQVYTSLVSQQLGLKCVNLGLSGGASDSAFRLANHYLLKIQPKIVFLLAPDQARLEILGIDRAQALNPWSKDALGQSNYYRQWLAVEENQRLNQEKNILAIELLCQRAQIKFAHLYSWHTVNHPDSTADKARDLSHWGPLRHQAIAAQVLETIGN
jgi:hypothetical protein